MNYFIRLLSVLPINNQWAAQTDSDWEGNSTFFLRKLIRLQIHQHKERERILSFIERASCSYPG